MIGFRVDPKLRPYLDVWPLPNGPAVGVNSGLANLFGVGSNPIGENFFVTRVDHHINDKQSIFARFTFDRGSLSTPDGLSAFNVPEKPAGLDCERSPTPLDRPAESNCP